MSRQLDDALSDCLERMSRGEDIRRCAARYPGMESELLPLLDAAGSMGQLASSVTYGAEAKARGLSRMMDALNERRAPRPRRLSFSILRPMVRPLAVGFAAMVVMGFVAGGTTAAAADSVPGDRLYWVKTTKESISLRLPRSDIGQAHAHAGLAGERVSEMRELLSRGDVAEAEQVANRVGSHLNRSARYSGVFLSGNPMEPSFRPSIGGTGPQLIQLRITLQRDGSILTVELRRLMQRMPPSEQRDVWRMMRRSELHYRMLIDALNAERSSQRFLFWRIDPSKP